VLFPQVTACRWASLRCSYAAAANPLAKFEAHSRRSADYPQVFKSLSLWQRTGLLR
jgi:hypothetical protein